jgi:hypothetical protein
MELQEFLQAFHDALIDPPAVLKENNQDTFTEAHQKEALEYAKKIVDSLFVVGEAAIDPVRVPQLLEQLGFSHSKPMKVETPDFDVEKFFLFYLKYPEMLSEAPLTFNRNVFLVKFMMHDYEFLCPRISKNMKIFIKAFEIGAGFPFDKKYAAIFIGSLIEHHTFAARYEHCTHILQDLHERSLLSVSSMAENIVKAATQSLSNPRDSVSTEYFFDIMTTVIGQKATNKLKDSVLSQHNKNAPHIVHELLSKPGDSLNAYEIMKASRIKGNYTLLPESVKLLTDFVKNKSKKHELKDIQSRMHSINPAVLKVILDSVKDPSNDFSACTNKEQAKSIISSILNSDISELNMRAYVDDIYAAAAKYGINLLSDKQFLKANKAVSDEPFKAYVQNKLLSCKSFDEILVIFKQLKDNQPFAVSEETQAHIFKLLIPYFAKHGITRVVFNKVDDFYRYIRKDNKVPDVTPHEECWVAAVLCLYNLDKNKDIVRDIKTIAAKCKFPYLTSKVLSSIPNLNLSTSAACAVLSERESPFAARNLVEKIKDINPIKYKKYVLNPFYFANNLVQLDDTNMCDAFIKSLSSSELWPLVKSSGSVNFLNKGYKNYLGDLSFLSDSVLRTCVLDNVKTPQDLALLVRSMPGRAPVFFKDLQARMGIEKSEFKKLIKSFSPDAKYPSFYIPDRYVKVSPYVKDLHELRRYLPISVKDLALVNRPLADKLRNDPTLKVLDTKKTDDKITEKQVRSLEDTIASNYVSVKTDNWEGIQKTLDQNNQIVLKVVASNSMLEKIASMKATRIFKAAVKNVAKSHPHGTNVIGWIRVNFMPGEKSGTDNLLVDEVQSDLPKIIRRLASSNNQHGVSFNNPKYAPIIEQLAKFIESLFPDAAMAVITEFAKSNGVQLIYYHTLEGGKNLKRNGNPPESLYTQFPVQHYFKKVAPKDNPLHIDEEFFVRKAKLLRLARKLLSA